MSQAQVLAAATHLASEPSIGSSLFKMLLALAIVGGAIWLCARVLQRVRAQANGARRVGATPGLRVISRQSLGRGLQLAVVSWHNRELLVGVAGQTVTLLRDERGAQSSNDSSEALASSARNDFSATSFVHAPASPGKGAGGSVVEMLRTLTERH